MNIKSKLFKFGCKIMKEVTMYVTSDDEDAINDMVDQFMIDEVISEQYNGCVCEEELKSGTTNIPCCNTCGKPLNRFWGAR